jgi:hypothetical protein
MIQRMLCQTHCASTINQSFFSLNMLSWSDISNEVPLMDLDLRRKRVLSFILRFYTCKSLSFRQDETWTLSIRKILLLDKSAEIKKQKLSLFLPRFCSFQSNFFSFINSWVVDDELFSCTVVNQGWRARVTHIPWN